MVEPGVQVLMRTLLYRAAMMCTSAQRTRTAGRVRQTTGAVHVRRPRHNDSVAVAPRIVPLAASLQSQST